MAKSNFLLGYGERLVEAVYLPPAGGEKSHPYSLEQAQARLIPRFARVARAIQQLPAAACPGDRAVALLTLHPTYVAKSYHPANFLRSVGLETVGTRTRADVVPERSTRRRRPEPRRTTELYVAGQRQAFERIAGSVERLGPTDAPARDVIKIEDFRLQPTEERFRPFPMNKSGDVLLELVLLARPTDREVLAGFRSYGHQLGVEVDFRQAFFSEGLCFLPLRAATATTSELLRFAFVRYAREMPHLRVSQPVLRAVAGAKPFRCTLPRGGPLDPSLRVAVFDGGLPPASNLAPWASSHVPPGLGANVPRYNDHGSAVTSALLFGSLSEGSALPVPYAHVDHFRVLDTDTAKDDQAELYTVLRRIRDILDGRKYAFVNLSLGPALPIDDDDVHAWTAVLDERLANGDTLAAIAVGNDGDLDRASGNARIQSPADCVNGLGVGAHDGHKTSWGRSPYSCIGPGRSPGVVKPDCLAFGGCDDRPFWVVDPRSAALSKATMGTSFAAPAALRAALGLRAHFGDILSPLALKALLVHHADPALHPREEVGWGRIPEDLEDLALSDDSSAHVLYQGEIRPAEWLRMPIPVPQSLSGNVILAATFCFATPVDAHDAANYTRSGLEVRFRPNRGRIKAKASQASTRPFFQAREFYLSEEELRRDAHKWETTLHHTQKFRGSSFKDPVFDVHYHARESGHVTSAAHPIRYALVVTISCRKNPALYDQIVNRYRTRLEPLRPQIAIPVRV